MTISQVNAATIITATPQDWHQSATLFDTWQKINHNVGPSEFLACNAADPRLVARVAVSLAGEQPSPEDSFSDIRTVQATFLDAEGRPTAKQSKHNYHLEFRKQQDVIDLVAYSRDPEGQLKIGLTECLRVPVAARHVVSDGKLPEESGLMWNLPGAYIRQLDGTFNINATIASILVNKLGVPIKDNWDYKPAMTGGSYLPSAGGSTECCQAWSVEVPPEFAQTQIRYGQAFEGPRRVAWVTPQEIVDGFFNGTYRDLRLVLAAFRLAREHHQEIEIKPNLLTGKVFNKEDIETLPLVGLDSFANWLAHSNPGQAHRVSVKDVSDQEPDRQGFLRNTRVLAQSIGSNGAVLGASFEADVAYRKTFDSVASSGHCWINNAGQSELYMLVVQNLRPAVAARELAIHPIMGELRTRRIEGIAESLEAEDLSKTSIISRAEQGVAEEGGVTVESRAQLIGSAFPSPGTNMELKYYCLASIDPSALSAAEHSADESVKQALMRPADIIELAEQGLIDEPSLELLAHILACTSGTQQIGNHTQFESAIERKEFYQLMASGSPLETTLAQTALEVNNQLHNYSVYRKLKILNEESLGTIAMRPSDPTDILVFDNFIPYFMLGATPSSESSDSRNSGLVAFDLAHDLFHFVSGGVVPFERKASGEFVVDTNGHLIPMSYKNYRRAMLDLECAAVWFSDVHLPERLGYQQAAKIFGHETLGAALADLGYTGEAAFDMLCQIQSTGKIPIELEQHPKFEQHKRVLVERLVRLYYRDNFGENCNLRKMYENWRRNPFAAQIAARFSPQVIARPLSATDYFNQILTKIETLPEGNNPLKARIAQSMNDYFRRTALSLAFYRDLISEECSNQLKKVTMVNKINSELDKLFNGYKELEQQLKNVHDRNPSTQNLVAYRLYRKLEQEVGIPAMQLEASIKTDSSLLGDRYIERYRNRHLPALRPGSFDLSSDAQIEFEKIRQRYEID